MSRNKVEEDSNETQRNNITLRHQMNRKYTYFVLFYQKPRKPCLDWIFLDLFLLNLSLYHIALF